MCYLISDLQTKLNSLEYFFHDFTMHIHNFNILFQNITILEKNKNNNLFPFEYCNLYRNYLNTFSQIFYIKYKNNLY